jgi:flagellar biosynthesis regulator FlaF
MTLEEDDVMQTMPRAARAYAVATTFRSQREQEADIFRRVNATLRAAYDGRGRIAQVRALADNDRLWITIVDLVCDPSNSLPADIRASLVSVGLAVQREMQQESPDLGFLVAINENVASGLAARVS